ncbi:MAG TPA: DUF5610 domain-containing protein [Candidatus Rifleibacterium sp.]|nr:DUF5610 domain-containing protein [Candidatus Rifleibacterium sp.]
MIDKLQMFLASLNNADNTGKTGAKNGNAAQNRLVNGLNADTFGLSQDARQKVIFANAQFQANYQVLKSMNSANGYTTSEETFSLSASYQFMQNVSGAGSDVSGTVDTPATGENPAADDAPVTETTAEQDMLTKLQEYFSPENTARRILDVATSFFSMSSAFRAGGDSESTRQQFADFIGGAIETGFSQARNLLGEMPDNVVTGIDKTHSLVFSGLNDFVKNGIDAEKAAPGGVLEKIAAYREEGRAQLNSVIKGSTAQSYNANGEAQPGSGESGKLLTRG